MGKRCVVENFDKNATTSRGIKSCRRAGTCGSTQKSAVSVKTVGKVQRTRRLQDGQGTIQYPG